MSVRRFTKKPVTVEALQLTDDNAGEVVGWVGRSYCSMRGGPGGGSRGGSVFIHTIGGIYQAEPGDWIIKSAKGDFYPCKSEVFDATYEAADG